MSFPAVVLFFFNNSLVSWQKTNNLTSTVAVDGTLFKKHPRFKGYMETALKELLPESNVKLMLSEDGSGKGAALVAAVAVKMAKA